jgi:sterol desaturase/sphingolipid hydroxylase (fatty acid hydroxylase superfamily)
MNLIVIAGSSFLFLFVVFRPLELAFPARPGQRFLRPAFLTDVCFFLGQYLLWGGLVIWMLTHVNAWIGDVVPSSFRDGVRSQAWWLQAIEVVLLSDFLIYWGHRLQHRVGFLWRFHAVHHSAEHMDWLAAHREHPLDTVYTMTLINFPAMLLGFPLETIAGFIVFRGIWAIYIHSNVRMPTGPLRILFGAPELHHWHHDRDRDAGNYGNVCPLMDVIFGTHVCPDHEPEHFGLNEPGPTTYLGHLVQPLLPRQRRLFESTAEAPRIDGTESDCNDRTLTVAVEKAL